MFREMTVGKKIGAGFCILILISLGLGAIAIFQMQRVTSQATIMSVEKVPAARVSSSIERSVQEVMLALRGYGYTESETYLKEGQTGFTKLFGNLQEASDLIEKSKTLTPLKTPVENAQAAAEKYQALLTQTIANTTELNQQKKLMEEASTQYEKVLQEYLVSQEEKLKKDVADKAAVETVNERILKLRLANELLMYGQRNVEATWQALAQRDSKIIQGTQANFAEIDKRLDQIRPLTRTPEDIQRIDATKKDTDAYKGAMNALLSAWMTRESLAKQRLEAGLAVSGASQEAARIGLDDVTQVGKDSVETLSASSNILIGGLIAALILGVGIAVFITRSITHPLQHAIDAVTSGSLQVASAASQISSSSQHLAEGATKQAASLEESSSALEELASQARCNAESAERANLLVEDARTIVRDTSDAMKLMVTTMGNIKESAGRISGIIRTIEEIAFQTNLLALNAAVESARAGEHGKGFAVVAEEVRSLAQRAASAAKDSASLIESSVGQANQGAEVVQRAAQGVQNVAENSSKIAENMMAINQASKQQAEGINQINLAVAQMDKVTQVVASNAEESASASEELNSQSVQMQGVVNELTSLVSGSSRVSGSPNSAPEFALDGGTHSLAPVGIRRGNGHSNGNGGVQGVKPSTQATLVLPFDDDEEIRGF
jgi:methyl-accepting chemotaxis protein